MRESPLEDQESIEVGVWLKFSDKIKEKPLVELLTPMTPDSISIATQKVYDVMFPLIYDGFLNWVRIQHTEKLIKENEEKMKRSEEKSAALEKQIQEQKNLVKDLEAQTVRDQERIDTIQKQMTSMTSEIEESRRRYIEESNKIGREREALYKQQQEILEKAKAQTAAIQSTAKRKKRWYQSGFAKVLAGGLFKIFGF